MKDFYFKVTVESAKNLPSSHCKESCVKYQLDYEVPKCEYWTHRVAGANKDPEWTMSHIHHIPVVTEAIAESLHNGKVVFSVFAL